MTTEATICSTSTLTADLAALGLEHGDGVFVHASLSSLGPVVGGARSVVTALLQAVGPAGLVAMPGFSTDAYFPPDLDRATMDAARIRTVEDAVLGYDAHTSPTSGMGAIAEAFRTWPGTQRSSHPATSICLNGDNATEYLEPHSLAWSTGPDSPLGHLRARPSMKILLIGVGWNRCSALHTAETLADHRRTKTRRFKTGPGDAPWMETPDVADDLDRLFPAVGAAAERTGIVRVDQIGEATSRLVEYAPLIDFATEWIDRQNEESGATH